MSEKKNAARLMRTRRRIKSRLRGTPERPRLQVRKTNKYLYAQIIDDTSGKVLVGRNILSKEASKSAKCAKNLDLAGKLGEELAAAALEKGIKSVVFDRGVWIFHGKIRAIAGAARKKGLEF